MDNLFNRLVEANKAIALMDIKGKQYAVVPERLKAFRMVYPGGTIETQIVSIDGETVVFRAEVRNEEGRLLGTGTAMEKQASSYINKTSYVENCETSAVGRALGMAGFGFDTSIASAEEVANAMLNQKKRDPKQEAPEELPFNAVKTPEEPYSREGQQIPQQLAKRPQKRVSEPIKPIQALDFIPFNDGELAGMTMAQIRKGNPAAYKKLAADGDQTTRFFVTQIDDYLRDYAAWKGAQA